MQSQNNTNLRVIVKPETLCTSTFSTMTVQMVSMCSIFRVQMNSAIA